MAALTINAVKEMDKDNGEPDKLSIPDDRMSMKSSVSGISGKTMGSRKYSYNQARRQSKWSLVTNQMAFRGGRGFQTPTERSPWKQFTTSELKQMRAAPKIEVENTYKMKPDPDMNFRPIFVEKEVKKILDQFLQTQPYDPQNAGYMTAALSEAVKARVKDIGFKRHKLIVQIFLGSQDSQSLVTASRCVWDAETDNFVSVCCENGTIFAIANVYAVYFE